jgi:hypothetical protein
MSRRTKVGLGALAAAGAAAVAAALVTGAGPTPEPAPSAVSPAAATASARSVPATEAGPHGSWDPEDLRARFEQLVPAELRAELAGLRDVPAAERLTELERIRDAALAGGYGADAQAGAERLVAMTAMLPPELYADLEALVTTGEAEIPGAVEGIRDRALAGGYGEQVRAGAEHLVAMAEQHGVDVRGDLDRYLPAGGHD